MIGIYKITSPTKKIYIGQSTDIKKRWEGYRKLNCKEQRKLYYSFLKHGVENHSFEVVCQCSIEELNEMERFYQDSFCVINKNGLNCRLTEASDRSGKMSEESCYKMSKSAKGKIMTIETRAKIGVYSKNVSIETRQKRSIALKGKSLSLEHRKKIGAGNKGKIRSLDNRARISESLKGNIPKNRKIVLHLLTGVFFESATAAGKCFNYNHSTFMNMLNGNSRVNKTNCIYI
jgi:group I intron endonuclease